MVLAKPSPILLGALVLALAVAANSQQYNNVWDAIMRDPNAARAKQMLTTMMSRGLPPKIVGQNQYIMAYVQDANSNITAFVPVNQAFEDLQLYVCMTEEELNNYLATHPDLVMDVVTQTLANTTKPVVSKDFKNNMKLPSFKKGFNIPLVKTVTPDNKTFYEVPGLSFNSSNIKVVDTDIMAGNSAMHLIDGIITSPEQVVLYRNISASYCGRPGAREAAIASVRKANGTATPAAAPAPAGSPTSGAPAGPSTVAWTVLVAVLGLLLSILVS